MIKTVRERLLASTIICGAVMVAAPAFAQQSSGDLTASGGAPVESIQDSNAVRSDAQGNNADDVEEIVVTGSRIPQPNLTSISPVTVVGQQDVQLRGVTRVEDLVNQLPSVFAAQSSSVSNGATGTAQVNLRGIGADRNLVLVNGRRLPFGSPNSTPADVNQVPSSLVERVEVLSGGAASIYGSDAISGVVNFIMQRDFEGVRLNAQYSGYQHNNDYDTNGNLREVIAGRSATNPAQFRLPEDNVYDGFSTEVSMLMGVSTEDGRGNITAYASYRDSDEILQRDRDYSACSIGVASATGFTCGGSSTASPGRIQSITSVSRLRVNADGTPFDTDPTVPGVQTGTVGLGLGNANLVAATNDSFRPFAGATDQYNFGPLNFYQRPDERYSFGAFGRYEFNDMVEAYAELMFTDYQTNAQIAPGGAFFGGSGPQFGGTASGGYLVGCDNPFFTGTQAAQLGCGTPIPQGIVNIGTAAAPNFVRVDPASQAALDTNGDNLVDRVEVLVGRRNTEGGGRQDNLGLTSYRIVTGLRGDLAEGLTYDIYGQFSEVTLSRSSINDFYANRIAPALDATRDAQGNPICRDPNAVTSGCVPYNAFDLAGSPSQASLSYLQGVAVQTGFTRQQVVSGAVTYDLGNLGVQSPLAENSIKTAFGAEYRRDELQSISDVTFETGGLSGQGGPTPSTRGSTEVYDLFAELQAPLIENQPGVDLLSFNASYRFSDYDSGVNANTYGFGGDYAPIEGLRFRASYARAVRAPNVIDLFTPQGLNLFDLDSDPCGPSRLATAALCASVGGGLGSSAYGDDIIDSPAGQYNFLQGGNPSLEPEVGDTYTVGVVFAPNFIDGLNVTLDYFNIDITQLITNVDPSIIVDSCYGVRGQTRDPSLCSFVQRSGLGTLWTNGGQVNALNTNIGGIKTSGYDLAANYTFDLTDFGLPDYGGFSVSYIATFLNELVTDPGVASPYDCAGFYGGACSSGTNGGVPNPEYRHNARVAWQTPINLDLTATWRYFGEVALFGNTANRVDAVLERQQYFDLAAAYRYNDLASFRFGVNNVFDDDPPLSASVGTSGNGNTYPQSYDAFGRYFFAGVTLDF
jgi:outer membrane receptor protein involved in Fe transport